MITLHNGEFSWDPKTFTLNGKEYPAPLYISQKELFEIQVRQLLIEFLNERKTINRFTKK